LFLYHSNERYLKQNSQISCHRDLQTYIVRVYSRHAIAHLPFIITAKAAAPSPRRSSPRNSRRCGETEQVRPRRLSEPEGRVVDPARGRNPAQHTASLIAKEIITSTEHSRAEIASCVGARKRAPTDNINHFTPRCTAPGGRGEDWFAVASTTRSAGGGRRLFGGRVGNCGFQGP
jgi:hypothetical protein